MAVAYDAFTASAAGTGDFSFTHTPVGTPRGALLFLVQGDAGDDQMSSTPTYGGVNMTEVALSPNLKAAAEAGGVHCYHLGASIPTGAQTVAATVGGAGTKIAYLITTTADRDTEVVDTDASINSDSVQTPTAVLSLGGVSCFCCIGAFWGGAASTVAPNTGWTSRNENAFAATVGLCYTYDTVGTSDVTIGYTNTASNDAIVFGIAIREAAAGGLSIPVAMHNYRRRRVA